MDEQVAHMSLTTRRDGADSLPANPRLQGNGDLINLRTTLC